MLELDSHTVTFDRQGECAVIRRYLSALVGIMVFHGESNLLRTDSFRYHGGEPIDSLEQSSVFWSVVAQYFSTS